MNDRLHRTEARTRRSWWPGWIWAVPIAAIAVAAWLGIRTLAQGGEDVVVTFDAAHGIKKGDTDVTFLGVKVGTVDDVALAKDGHHVEATLSLDRDVDKYLRSGTRFWLVGAKFSISDLSSLKALVAGPEIAMEPGPGKPADRFTGLDEPPAIQTHMAGTPIVLTAGKLDSLQQGSTVFYAGQDVGSITGTHILGSHRFEFDAFIRAPYDRLIDADTKFWNAQAVEISAENDGVKAELVSPEALIGGGVAFDTPAETGHVDPVKSGMRFPLYDDRKQAQNTPTGPQVSYLLRFDGDVGKLEQGAAVKLRGFRVGQVTGFGLRYDAQAGNLDTSVHVELEPKRLNIEGTMPANGDWRPATDAALKRLIAEGLRARLAQDPPIVGDEQIELAFVPNAPAAVLQPTGGLEAIPTTSSGDIASIMAQTDQVMSTLHQISQHIDTLISSPQIADSIGHLDRTLQQVDRTIHRVGPELNPLVASLRQTADQANSTVAAANKVIAGNPMSQDKDLPAALRELTDAARAVRSLANYLDQHPEALLEGKESQTR